MPSCHLHLDRSGGPGPGGATAGLREEHEVILRALLVLERLADRLAAGRPVSDTTVGDLVQLLQTFADRCHHGKEEERLFPALTAKGVGAPLAPFLDEHAEGRGYLRTLAGAAPAAERAAAARRYIGLLRDHIERENAVLFPMADELFTADEHAALAEAYEEVEHHVVGPAGHGPLLAALARLEAAVPAEEVAQ
jgi:hemerythrin-like domain-containing protein